jgi:CRISPR system Cascade subunit CasC
MFVELHILQNFAPSNLNRDDTNAPKDCEFGGYRRARISSQCLKRAIRTSFKDDGLLPADQRAVRTRLLADTLSERLVAAGRDATDAKRVGVAALGSVGLQVKDEGRTEYLVFLGEDQVQALVEACLANWDALSTAAAPAEGAAGKAAKKGAKEAVPSEVREALAAVLDGSKAADLALFGRMLADRPDKNVDAASQVAHAISTNKVSTEFDFYTAVDDLQPGEETGAGMMGTVEFNSACFYRYSNVDTQQLARNLGGDADLARESLEAFLRASIQAIPTGKQNSMAAHNLPSLVFAVVRDGGLENLANAFARPVRPRRDGSGNLVEDSASQLGEEWGKLRAMYGEGSVRGTWAASMVSPGATAPLAATTGSVDALVAGVLEAVKFAEAAKQ